MLPAAQPAQEESQIVLLANSARKYPRIYSVTKIPGVLWLNAPNFSQINEFEPKTEYMLKDLKAKF